MYAKMILTTGICLLVATAATFGQVIAEHVGDTDPETEGFSFSGGGVTGAISEMGYDAWQINDDSSDEPMYRYREAQGYTAELDEAVRTLGWKLTATLRVVTEMEASSTVSLHHKFSTNRFSMSLGKSAANELLLRMAYGDAPSATVPDVGDDYNTIEMIYTPTSDIEGTSDILVNGAVVIDDWPGPGQVEGGINYAQFGSGGSTAQGHGSYAYFKVEVGAGGECSPGDADKDGDVDDDDLSLLLANWGSETAGCSQGEFSGAAPVNDDDLSLLLANWTGPLAGAVPEPATMLLMGLAAPALLRPRRKA